MAEETTQQVTKHVPNPTGKGGFSENPQNRNPGGWKKESSFSYQMNRFKDMTIEELENWNNNTSKNKRTVAEDLAFQRIFNARLDLAEFKEVADRTEGKAKQIIEQESTVNINTNEIVAKQLQDILQGNVENEAEDVITSVVTPVIENVVTFDPTKPLEYDNHTM